MKIIFEDLATYPLLSIEQESLLRKEECPEEVIEILDKTLWCTISGSPLCKELSLYEVFRLDSWVNKVKIPEGFNPEVLKALSSQLGFTFK